MARTPKATDFEVDVDGIGRFIFARRNVGDVYKIRGRYTVLTDGHYDAEGNMADLGALGFVTIQTLLVSGPPGFDLEALDPILDDDFDTKVMSIFAALRAKELSFRPQPKAGSEGAGAGAGGDVRTVVPQEVQPSAE